MATKPSSNPRNPRPPSALTITPCASATCCSAPDKFPIDPATGNLVSGDIKAQTERVLQNVKAILDDQKLTFANVVKSTVFMTNLADFAGMNEVYAKYFTEDFPARSTIQVAALPKGANVEIEVVAHF